MLANSVDPDQIYLYILYINIYLYFLQKKKKKKTLPHLSRAILHGTLGLIHTY